MKPPRTLSESEFAEHEKLYRQRVYLVTDYQRYRATTKDGLASRIQRGLEYKMEKARIDAELMILEMEGNRHD